MGKQFHPTLDNLSMLGLKLIHVNKNGPRCHAYGPFVRRQSNITLKDSCVKWKSQIKFIIVGDTLYLSGIILGMGSANERSCYNVTPSLIGQAHTQNDPYP